MKTGFRLLLILLYTLGLAAFFYGLISGWGYYKLALVQRPHHELHILLKPGGRIGHGLGLVGSAMVLLLFLYSLRKRQWLGLRWGNPARWLDIHIFFGIIGPLLITLHTSFKFNGIVSISYFSMMAVMLSGFFGRYIYMQIPRDEEGHSLSFAAIREREKQMETVLRERFNVSEQVLTQLASLLTGSAEDGRIGLIRLIALDLTRPFRWWRLRRRLRAECPELSSLAFREMMHIIRKRHMLMRRRFFLHTAQRIFHYWHVLHKPFAVVMIVFMFIHVVVAAVFGYGW